jgi:hypothetical protein
MVVLPETTSVQCSPGTKINLHNKTDIAQKYRIDYGPYGSITINAIIGSLVEITVGDIPPIINILESESEPGVRAVNV